VQVKNHRETGEAPLQALESSNLSYSRGSQKVLQMIWQIKMHIETAVEPALNCSARQLETLTTPSDDSENNLADQQQPCRFARQCATLSTSC